MQIGWLNGSGVSREAPAPFCEAARGEVPWADSPPDVDEGRKQLTKHHLMSIGLIVTPLR